MDKMFSMNTAQAVEGNCLKYLSEIIINSNISFSLMTEEYKMGKLNIVGLENSKYKTYNWSFLGYYVGTNQSLSSLEIPTCSY